MTTLDKLMLVLLMAFFWPTLALYNKSNLIGLFLQLGWLALIVWITFIAAKVMLL